jgi:hypothetical protein
VEVRLTLNQAMGSKSVVLLFFNLGARWWGRGLMSRRVCFRDSVLIVQEGNVLINRISVINYFGD